MAPTLYFGIEFEFCLAYNEPGQPDPDPYPTKFTAFPISETAIQESLQNDTNFDGTPFTREQLFRDPSRIGLRTDIFLPSARQHIGQTLIDAGLPYDHTNDSEENIQNWHITTDGSIDTTPDPRNLIEREYIWAPIEITSPAYECTPENLTTISKVCFLLQANYLTKTNTTCGLHVHFSLGTTPSSPIWSFTQLQRLLQFFWAFHTQFDTIQPAHRQKNTFALSMRVYALMIDHFWSTYSFLPSPTHGVLELDKTWEIVAQSKGSRPEKYVWEHLDGSVLLNDLDVQIYDEKEVLRKAFYAQMKLAYFEDLRGQFDPNAGYWPAHREVTAEEYAGKVALPPVLPGEEF
ncbi:hypothetical protein BDZ45DRAFT_752739 [Acephala macrosclerotiorum]|nr:hypothetical protein BDZ45DRAFT_752739 [Acephala macrosclerotiorum]